MKSERWASWMNLLANVSVLVGIALLAFELQQNREATLGDTQQNLLEMIHDLDTWLQDPNFAAAVVKADRGDELTDVQAFQYKTWMSGRLDVCEHVFERYRAGIVTIEGGRQEIAPGPVTLG